MRPPLLLLLVLVPSLAVAATAPTSPDPTPEETLMLEYLNRFRADPPAEADRIAPANGGTISGVSRDVDADVFRREMKSLQPVPPLVFNLLAVDVARKHSTYMVHNGQTHVEEPGKEGFTAVSALERCKLGGFVGGGGENCFAQARDPWLCHVAFVVDAGPGGEGGMQPGRGHRTNMHEPRFREIGLGAVPNGSGLSVTHELGDRREVPRFAGGVAYVDADGDAFYSLGEGRGDVVITASDGATVRTWPSGAFTLELKSTAAVTLTAEIDGAKASKSFPAGSDNVKFDWVMPAQVEADHVDKLLAEVDRQKDPASPAAFKARVALHLGARGLQLDDQRAARVADATKDVAAQLDEAQATVRAALDGDDAKALKKAIAEGAKPFRPTAAAAWFQQADTLVTARGAVAGYEREAKQRPVAPTAKRQLLQELESGRDASRDPDLRARFSALIARVHAVGG